MTIDQGLVIVAKLPKIHFQNTELFTKSAFCKELKICFKRLKQLLFLVT